MEKKMLDDFVDDWRFEIDSLEYIQVLFNGEWYRKFIFEDNNGLSYINFKGNRYYIGNVDGEEF